MKSDDEATGGFSISSGGGSRSWSAEDMRRAVPLPTPTPSEPGRDELVARVITAAMGRLAASGSVTIPQIAYDLGEPRENVEACVRLLAQL